MFESARLKLTAWYLFIIMLISIFFSVAIYQVATSEIERVINRIEYRQVHPDKPIPDRPNSPQGDHQPPSLDDLEETKMRLIVTLLFINIGILIAAGGAGYFLAGRTLRPIKIMIDEQNQFISSASHELRTPITTMRAEMESSLMQNKLTDKKAKELINSNLEELETLQNLTGNLLRLAHVHNFKSEKYDDVVSLQELINAAEKKVSQLAKQKNITIYTQIDEIKLVGDSHSLIEVFVILLDNAIKYSPVRTTIHVTTVIHKTSFIVHIADQGPGIPKEDIDHIFERFYRADKSRTHADGFGLGLSIAKKIVETHHGFIAVANNKKAGVTFSVTLPLFI